LEEGRNFTEGEVISGANIVLIGHKLKSDLFGVADPIGKHISVAGRKYTIIGSLAEKGSSFGGNQDNIVIIPLQAAQSAFPAKQEAYDLSVQTFHVLDLDQAIAEAIGLMRSIRKLPLGVEDDFEIVTNDAMVGTLKENISQIASFALIIGFITLLGAAVALTNIMLVSVTERTREIGVRKAMGATTINIRNQFLTEAIVICQMGGLLGILLGILLGNVVSSFMGSGFVVPWGWVIFGVLLCFAVGVLAGLYPALKAAKQDPIDALRYE
jgi:putative ABC transport system permease protein